MVYLADITTSLTNVVTRVYMQTSLVGLVLAMAIESGCIPLPSEMVMPLAGVMLVTGKSLGGINPLLGFILVALADSLGGVIGSMAAYGIGDKGGRPLRFCCKKGGEMVSSASIQEAAEECPS